MYYFINPNENDENGRRPVDQWQIIGILRLSIDLCIYGLSTEFYRSTVGFTIFPYYVALVLNSSYVDLLL